MRIQLFKLLGLSLALAFLAWATVHSGLVGLAQAGKLITVCASGCDFSKIQAAIDAAPNGSTIQVQTGSYKENLTIRNKDGLTLQGAGREQVTLDGNGPQQKDITPGILILSSRNITVTGFKITNSRRGLEADDTTLLFIETNNFEKNLRVGITLIRSQGEIKGNLVQGTLLDVDGSVGEGLRLFQGSQATLTDNVISENADCGLMLRFAEGKSNQASGSNNTIQNNKGGDLCGSAPTSLLAQPPAEGTLDQVAVPTDVPTIQEAVNKVKAGGTITVAAGTYKEQIQIYKSVKIIGAGPDQTVIQAPGLEWVALNLASSDAAEVTLEGLRITGGRRGANLATGPSGTATVRQVKIDGNSNGKPSDGGLWVFEQVSATFDQATISGNRWIGLWVFGQAKVTVQNSTITNNASAGISLADANAATIRQSTISNNASNGIGLTSSSQATILNSTITNNSGRGVSLSGSSKATLDDNTISSNVVAGINLFDTAQATITNNRVTGTKPDAQGNYGIGIAVQGNSKATIQGSTISGNQARGLELFENARVTLEDTTLSGNIGGVFVYGSSQVTITNSRVTNTKSNAQGNSGEGIYATDSSKLTVTGSTISGSAIRGILVVVAAQATIQNNTISGNKESGIVIGTGSLQNETAQAEISHNTIQNNGNCGAVADSDSGIKITGQGNTISGNTKGQLCNTPSKFPAGFGGGK